MTTRKPIHDKPLIFNDLGDRTRCDGPDLIRERIRTVYGPEITESEIDGMFVVGSRNYELQRKYENIVYANQDLTHHYFHRLNNHPYPGDTVKITLELTSHAQARMDSRCVTKEELKKAVQSYLDRLAELWNSGNKSEYKKRARHFLEGSRIKNDGISYQSKRETKMRFRLPVTKGRTISFGGHKLPAQEITLTVPSLVNTSGSGSAGRLTRGEIKVKKCIDKLEDLNFMVNTPSNQRRASFGGPYTVVVSSMGDWLPRARGQFKTLSISVNLNGKEQEIENIKGGNLRTSLKPFTLALQTWVRLNLRDKALSDDSEYVRNAEAFYKNGFTITDSEGVSYTLSPSRGFRPLRGSFRGFNRVYFSADTMYGSPNTIEAELTLSDISAGASTELSNQRKINRVLKECLDILLDDGHQVIDPLGQEVTRDQIRTARFFGLLSTPMSNFEMKRFVDQLRWMFRKGQLDVLHHVDRTNTCHIIKLSAKGVTVEVKGFFVNQDEPGSNYKNIRVVVDGVPKRVSDPREAHDFIFEVFSELGLRR
jgi:hypothetical protein